MEEKKVYTRKDLKELLKKTKKSMRRLEVTTFLNRLLVDIAPELGEGEKSECFDESDESLLSRSRETFLEDFEEHEKNVAELKKAVLYLYSAYVEDK